MKLFYAKLGITMFTLFIKDMPVSISFQGHLWNKPLFYKDL